MVDSDIGLILLAQQGDQMAYTELIKKYDKYCSFAMEGLYTQKGEREDILQNCRIGLYKAILTYKEEKGSFISYARMCIKSACIDAIKMHNRKKQRILNFSVDISNLDGGELAYTESFEDDYINQNLLEKIKGYLLENFSEIDREVFIKYIDGYSYLSIANEFNITAKKVDNIVQKIKRKLRVEFNEN